MGGNVSKNKNKMADKPKLYTSWFCPYSQRAWIALILKGVDFEYVEKDPNMESTEWLTISPTGMVPVIQHNGHTIYESIVCYEYVDEAWTGKALLPKEPHQRALHRIWSNFVDKEIVPNFAAVRYKPEKDEKEEAAQKMMQGVNKLFEKASQTGPFFSGDQPGMVDVMLATFAIRFWIIRLVHDFDLTKMANYERYNRWFSAIQKIEAIKETTAEKKRYIEHYGLKE